MQYLPMVMPRASGDPCLSGLSADRQDRQAKGRPLTSPKSFTLIEILIVVVILGLIAGLAVPNFSNAYANFTLSETAKNIAFLMRYAQSRAIMKGKECELKFDSGNLQYQLKEKAEDTEEIANSIFQPIRGRLGRNFSIPQGVVIEAENPHILFYPDGKIDKARIYLKNKREKYFTISTQEQAGYVQVFDFKVE